MAQNAASKPTVIPGGPASIPKGMINLPSSNSGSCPDETTFRTQDYTTVLIGVEWPDDMKIIELTKDEVLAILDGGEHVQEGQGYGYDGLSYTDTWRFSKGELIVTYANDDDPSDEGEGWIGSLTGVDFVEFDP